MKKAAKEFVDGFKGPTPYVDLAGTVFDAAVRDLAPSGRKVHFLNDLLHTSPSPPRFVETIFLQRLAEMADAAEMNNRKWPTAAVQQGLRTVQEAERTTIFDPRGLPWIEPLHQTATNKRREGEALLFAGRLASWEQSIKPLSVAEQDFQTINSYLQAFQQAYMSLDEAMTVLPGYVPYFVSRREFSQADQQAWTSAVQITCDLQQLLANPSAERLPPVDDLVQKVQSLARQLKLLDRPFSPEEVENCASRRSRTIPRSTLRYRHAWPAPVWKPDSVRRSGWPGRTWAGGCTWPPWQSIRLSIRASNRNLQPTPHPRRAGKASCRETRRIDLWRTVQRLSIDILKLGGMAAAGQMEQEYMQASRDRSWPSLALKLQEVWTTQLSKQYANEKDLAVKERLIHILPPFDDDAERLAGITGQAPAGQLRRQEAQRFWKWLGKLYESESNLFAGQDANRELANFYSDAAQEYLNHVP